MKQKKFVAHGDEVAQINEKYHNKSVAMQI